MVGNPETIEALRKDLSESTGRFVGYNDPQLSHLIAHAEDPGEVTPGASGVHDGFCFGGEVYPSPEAQLEPIYLQSIQMVLRISKKSEKVR